MCSHSNRLVLRPSFISCTHAASVHMRNVCWAHEPSLSNRPYRTLKNVKANTPNMRAGNLQKNITRAAEKKATAEEKRESRKSKHKQSVFDVSAGFWVRALQNLNVKSISPALKLRALEKKKNIFNYFVAQAENCCNYCKQDILWRYESKLFQHNRFILANILPF